MDVSLVIKERLKELGLEQKDLAVAAGVTESYISQLLARKKTPPAPGRTDIYDKIGKALRLPGGQLSSLAERQRLEELRLRVAVQPQPLFPEMRSLLLRKCAAKRKSEFRLIFVKEPLGELERLVTQKLLEVTQDVVRKEGERDAWLTVAGKLTQTGKDPLRAAVQRFLTTDGFQVSNEACSLILGPLIQFWDINLRTFAMDVALHPKLADVELKRFEFAEQPLRKPPEETVGLLKFLEDSTMSGDAKPEEIAFLRALPFPGRQPSAIYYYRELQNLRDRLHFLPGG